MEIAPAIVSPSPALLDMVRAEADTAMSKALSPGVRPSDWLRIGEAVSSCPDAVEVDDEGFVKAWAWYADTGSRIVQYTAAMFAGAALVQVSTTDSVPERYEGDWHDCAGMLHKASSIPEGARWITARPNGPGSKGVPILIQEHPHQKGVWSVIGGAGGKLNYLKVRGIKPEGSYKTDLKEKAAAKLKARKEQAAKDKAAGTHKDKAKLRQQLKAEKTKAEKEFIQTVVDSGAIDNQKLSQKLTDNQAALSQASPAEKIQLEKKQHAELLAAAKEAVGLQKKVLVADPEALKAAFEPDALDDAEPDQISAADLDLVKPPVVSDFKPDFSGMAKDKGLDEAELAAEVAAVKAALQPALAGPVEGMKAAVTKGIGTALQAAQAKSKPDLAPVVVEAKKAVQLLAAHQKMLAVQKAAHKAIAEVDHADEPQAYVLKVDTQPIEKIKQSVEDELRTAATTAFLAKAGEQAEDSLHNHVNTGAFNAVNALTQTVAGVTMVDRAAVDVLGAAGAAQVVARRLRKELPPDKLEAVRAGLEGYHVAHHPEASKAALERVEALHAAAKALEMQAAQGGDDIVLKSTLNRRRMKQLVEAQKVLGQSLGEFEAHAALIAALNDKRDEVEVSLGRAPVEAAVTQARAIGLKPGEYQLDRIGANVVLTVNAAGMDKLAAPVDTAGTALVRRNLDIMEGAHDEDGWLPGGFANRADLALKPAPGIAPSMAEPFKPGPDLAQSIRDYIGSRAADGDAPADILSALHSSDMEAAGGDGYSAALGSVLPADYSEVDALRSGFDVLADKFVSKRYGVARSPLNKQTFPVSDSSQDALHRAFAEKPHGPLGYVSTADLTLPQQKAIRDWHAANAGPDTPERAAARKALEAHAAKEPERFLTDAGGNAEQTPEWGAWNSQRLKLAGALKAAGNAWGDLVERQGGPEQAFRHAQGLMRSDVSQAFTKHYNTLHPDAPLQLGKAGERHTIGIAGEQQLAKMAATVGPMFKPGQPVKLFHASMSGPDGIKRQRAIKFIDANKRAVLGFGVGSGKTGIGLGAFAHLHTAGKAKKGVFVVPSIVQGQFGAEALRFLKPGEFKWHCQPGATHESRRSSYKSADTHFTVVTHQAFRDDLLRMASDHGHGMPEAVAEKMGQMDAAGRQAFIKGVLDKEGINFDFVMADEAHGLLDRDGKENSSLSNVTQAVTDGADYYVHASGDPVKNDASEIHSLLSKMDRTRYADKAAFMRSYSGDTQSAADALKREMARHVYTAAIKPDVQVTRTTKRVPLTDGQKTALAGLGKAIARVKTAKLKGGVDVDAVKELMPEPFAGAAADQHETIAKQLAETIPLLKESATKRIIDNHADAGKLHEVAAHAAARKGKPGVVFARSLEAVDNIKKRLEADGHRVITITGADSSQAKAEAIQAFNPDQGERKADIIVCSDAAATGANLQSGQWLLQYDTPDTAMVHAQRAGRINRIGQKNDIELTDLVAEHESEDRARERLDRKYGLRDLVTSPMEGMDDTGLAWFIRQRQVAQQQAMAA